MNTLLDKIINLGISVVIYSAIIARAITLGCHAIEDMVNDTIETTENITNDK